jgi:hypothetical protein
VRRPILLLGLSLLLALDAWAGGNQLKNGGFESAGADWTVGSARFSGEAHGGKSAAMMTQAQPQWSSLEQWVFLPKEAAKVALSGWMRTKALTPGKESWEAARLNLEFRDAKNQLVGGYQTTAGIVSGDSEWKSYAREYTVPSGADRVLVQCQMGNCVGTAWFDDVSLTLLGADGKELDRRTFSGPSDKGSWYPLEIPLGGSSGVWVDWSGLLDAPAGKHGFLKSVEGHLRFEDGTPARFWGTNLVGPNIFCSHEQADRLADRLAKLGVNMLRLHNMDGPWARPNVFGNATTTRKLDPAQMEKVDYLIAALKKKGVYVYLDLLVHRDFLKADGVEDPAPEWGGKQVGFFAPRLIELQKEYAAQWMEHVNLYTRLAYKDEPALAGSEFVNEATPYLHFSGDLTGEGPYREMLESMWAESPYKKKTLGRFVPDWENQGRLGLKDAVGDGDAMLKFFFTLQTKYLGTMTRSLRQSGCRYPLAGSNYPNHILADEAAQEAMDVILYNGYWDHPKVWKIQDDWSRITSAPIDNQAQLSDFSGALLPHFAKAKLAGKPFLITEWNHCYPNEYRLEGVPLMAAYASLQGWDGALQFDFDHEIDGPLGLKALELSSWPDQLAQWVVAAPLFHRRDVKEAPGEVVESVTEDQVFTMPSASDFLDRSPWLPYVTKVSRKLMAAKPAGEEALAPFRAKVDLAAQRLTSETGELVFDGKDRTFQVQTPRVQGFVGTWEGREVDFPSFRATLKNPWASVFLVSKEAVPLESAATQYLVVTTPMKMTGASYAEERGALSSTGNPPLLAQVAEGKVVLKRVVAASRVTVRPVRWGGELGKAIKLEPVKGGLAFPLEEGRSFVYEISYR